MARELCGDLVAAAKQLDGIEIIVCPPATLIELVSDLVKTSSIQTGGQDIDVHQEGAHTGQISAPMMLESGASHIILGHSERRTNHGESKELVAAKVDMALENDLIPVICLGETKNERENDWTEQIVGGQLQAIITHCGVEALSRSIIAYEPVWAIGTGLTATPEQAQQVHQYIRGTIAKLDGSIAAQCRILYGGSMNPKNAAELMAEPDIDGGLIGGASLNSQDFLAICKAAMPPANP